MNATPDNFEQLRRILALKRYEQPPPRFFREFPENVMTRLQLARQVEPLPWWSRFSFAFELRPVAACAASMLLCGLLFGGLMAGGQFKPPGSGLGQAASSGPGEHAAGLASQNAVLLASAEQALPVAPPDDVLSSTEPVVAELPAASPFDRFSLRVQRASITFGFGTP